MTLHSAVPQSKGKTTMTTHVNTFKNEMRLWFNEINENEIAGWIYSSLNPDKIKKVRHVSPLKLL